MPLTNLTIMGLNEITTFVRDKSVLTEAEIDEIKSIFRRLVEGGEQYDVSEIEYWFRNEGSWNTERSIVRIANMSGYVQDKFQQTSRLRILSDDHDCGH